MKIRLYDLGEFFEIEFPFNRSLVEELKRIPARERYWNPKLKRWGVKKLHKDLVMEMLARYFGREPYEMKHASTSEQILAQQRVLMAQLLGKAKGELVSELDPESIRIE